VRPLPFLAALLGAYARWLPAQDEQGAERFPVLFDLVGFTASGLAHTK
jgi:hypothetical protein